MNRTDELGAAAVYVAAQGLVLCHKGTPTSTDKANRAYTYIAVKVLPSVVPRRDANGVTVPVNP